MDDQNKLKSVTPTIGKLEDLQERMKDDYSANKALRDMFRTRKKEIKASEDKDNEFLRKRSLDIPLLAESEEDAKIASLIRLQPSQSMYIVLFFVYFNNSINYNMIFFSF